MAGLFDLSGKVALVTGANTGLGQGIALALAEAGADIAAAGIAPPTETFTDRRVIEMGGVTVEVLHLGPAHSPGDTQVWLPGWGLMIAGDIAFHERMPPIFEGTCTACWICGISSQ